MTLFSLGIFQGTATWSDMARNLAWTIPGNIVGGGLLIGLAYAYMSGARKTAPMVVTVPESAAVPNGALALAEAEA